MMAGSDRVPESNNMEATDALDRRAGTVAKKIAHETAMCVPGIRTKTGALVRRAGHFCYEHDPLRV